MYGNLEEKKRLHKSELEFCGFWCMFVSFGIYMLMNSKMLTKSIKKFINVHTFYSGKLEQ